MALSFGWIGVVAIGISFTDFSVTTMYKYFPAALVDCGLASDAKSILLVVYMVESRPAFSRKTAHSLWPL
jgi:hypothetical protein